MNRVELTGFTNPEYLKYILFTHGLLFAKYTGDEFTMGKAVPIKLPSLNGNIQEIEGIYASNQKVASLTVHEDCELVYLTSTDNIYFQGQPKCHGYFDLICRYASILADIDTTLTCVTVNERAFAVITSPNSNVTKKLKPVIKEMQNGNTALVVEENLIGNIQINPMKSDLNSYKNISEMHNFVLCEFYQQLGINAPWSSLKRERVQSAELESSDEMSNANFHGDILRVQSCFDIINKKYNQNLQIREIACEVCDVEKEGENIVDKSEMETSQGTI